MKKVNSKPTDKDSVAMEPDYDFSGGVRGKYFKAYRKGHTVAIHEPDGSTTKHYFGPADGAVMLDPDVRKHFRDSETVNRALRALIPSRKPVRSK